jgi:hypothetical protein
MAGINVTNIVRDKQNVRRTFRRRENRIHISLQRPISEFSSAAGISFAVKSP